MANNNSTDKQGGIKNNNLNKTEEEDEKKKNKKIFIVIGVAVGVVIIIIILILLLFTFCRRGSAGETEATGVEMTEVMEGSEETETLEDTSGASGETSSETEESTEETTAEETTDEEETTETEETTADEEAIAPTITLATYMGPVYSSADGVCYYRVQANVTGTPAPTIVWSRNDGSGLGPNRAQVNLHSPSETYTLTATATNSAGSDTESITLSWGCNRPPTVHEITLMGDHIAGVDYTVSAYATDPDGDTLTYQWSASGGSIANPNINPVVWTTTSTPGFYDITVTVNDGRGGTDSLTENVEVTAPNRAPVLGDIAITEQKTGYPAAYIYTNQTYNISVPASDPDGDTLNFSWSATGGTVNNSNSNPAIWKAPGAQGYYTINISVNDGRGGTASTFKYVYVQTYLY